MAVLQPLSPPTRLLRFTGIRSSTFIIIAILLLLPRENFREEDQVKLEYGGGDAVYIKKNSHNNNQWRSPSFMMMMVGAVEDDENKLRTLFIEDIKKLLTHNQVFYNTYGHPDPEVDLAFGEARIAADIIYLYPRLFQTKVRNVNERIQEALRKGEVEKGGQMQPAMTADGVPVYFVDRGLILLGVMGGVVRFP